MFVAVTEDGWMNTVDSLRISGHFIEAAIYYATFILFVDLCVGKMIIAVVATNMDEA